MKLTRLNDLIEDGKTLKGRWRIGPNHELQYKAKEAREEIKLTGSLVAAEPDALVFSVTEKQEDQKSVTHLQKLTGAWKLDSKNRITFEVEKESGRNDVLTFKGAWEINKSQELVYTYERVNLKTKAKETRELVFKGSWDISEKNSLIYSMGADSSSVFRFRGSFQTKSILAKKGEIRYQAGVEAKGKRRIQTITLFGKWKLSKDFALYFEVEYGGGRKKTIAFGGEYSLDGESQIAVNLRSQKGKPMGLELILTKDILNGGGQAFVRLQKSLEESRVEAGARFKW